MAASPPMLMPTPTCKGQKYWAQSARTDWHNTLLTKRRNVSPTAMGQTPPLFLGRAWSRAPAKWGATAAGASPLASSWHKTTKWATTSSPCAVDRVSLRWSARSPEGPGAEARAKLLMALVSASCESSGTAAGRAGPNCPRSGAGAWGCWATSCSKVAELAGKGGGSTKAAQARESSPSAAKAQHRLCWAAVCFAESRRGARSVRTRRSSQSSILSPASQRWQRRKVASAACRWCRAPAREGATSTAFGNIRSSCHAVMVLEQAAAASARARHWAQAARATCGTWRAVLTSQAMMPSRVGKPGSATLLSPRRAACWRLWGRQRGWVPL